MGWRRDHFMVSWFHLLHFWDIEMTIGFVVSFTPSLGQGNDKRFHGFVVSSFRPLHL